MALPTIYLKNHEEVVQNSVGQMSSSPIAPWWSVVRSESVYGQSLGPFSAFSLDYLRKEENHNVTKETGRIIKLGDFKVPKDGKKSPVDISFLSSLPENGARSDLVAHLGPRKEMDAHLDRHNSDCCFGYFSAFGPQISGRVLLPFSLATDDGPTYVNAKQYHGILRRRISRAKAMKGRRPARARKSYLHESRHLHAMRRPRGCGGRFLKKITTKTTKADDSTRAESPTSQNSEVFQADYKDRLNHSGSEATNMFLRENLSNLPINHRVLDLGHGLFVPAKWGII